MLKAKIESILFVTNRPLSINKLMEICLVKNKNEIIEAVDELADDYTKRESGLRLLRHGESVQMATAGETADLVREYLKDETTGEMTKPSLETLTIIAYRGPLTKGELEQIRGVNCSLILRNLMMRGLVEVQGDVGNPLSEYQVTMDFIRFLGVSSVEELPDYSILRSDDNVIRAMEEQNQKAMDGTIKKTDSANEINKSSSDQKEDDAKILNQEEENSIDNNER